MCDFKLKSDTKDIIYLKERLPDFDWTYKGLMFGYHGHLSLPDVWDMLQVQVYVKDYRLEAYYYRSQMTSYKKHIVFVYDKPSIRIYCDIKANVFDHTRTIYEGKDYNDVMISLYYTVFE